MGFLDDTVNEFENLVKEHPDQARGALDKAEQYVEERTGGKYDEQIKAGREQAENYLGIQDDQQQPAASDEQKAPASDEQQTPSSDEQGSN